MKVSGLILFHMLAEFALQVPAVWAAPAEGHGVQFVYFGTYTSETSRGIYRALFEPDTGKLGVPELAAETRNPTFLAVDAENRVLYAVNEISDFGTGNLGSVSAFSVNQKDGRLTFLNQQASGGSGPCHLSVARSGRCVLVANYGSGSVAVLPVSKDGHLQEPSTSIQHRGSSVNPRRQEGPHAHFITWDPAGRVILTCDLGLDKVLLYQLDRAQRVLAPQDPPSFALKPGSGPRHLAFGADGHYAYILNEISSTLTICSYDAARRELKEVQTISTLPEDFTGANTGAEIAVHPDGKFLYASNRGHDSIAVFAIDPSTGTIKLLQLEPTQGRTPRHFVLDPTARWLLAENQDSDSVVLFAVDPRTGRLSPTGSSQRIGAPVCAVFVPRE